MPYTRNDDPAPIGPVTCVECGQGFTPKRGAWFTAQYRYGPDLTTYPWCCSTRCCGKRAGAGSTRQRQALPRRRHPQRPRRVHTRAMRAWWRDHLVNQSVKTGGTL